MFRRLAGMTLQQWISLVAGEEVSYRPNSQTSLGGCMRGLFAIFCIENEQQLTAWTDTRLRLGY